MSDYELEMLAEIAALKQQLGLMEYAAQMNFEMWQKAEQQRQADGLNHLAENYPVSVDELHVLVRGFGELAMAGFKL